MRKQGRDFGRFQDQNQGGGRHARDRDRELPLREELADEAVIGESVRHRDGLALVTIPRACSELHVMPDTRQRVQTGAANHHHQVKGDDSGNQEYAQKSHVHDCPDGAFGVAGTSILQAEFDPHTNVPPA